MPGKERSSSTLIDNLTGTRSKKTNRAGTAVSAMLIAGTSIACAARYLDPARFWLVSLAAIALPLLGAANLTAGVLWAFKKKWVPLGLHLFVVLLIVQRHVSPLRLARPEPSDSDITAMTFNVPRLGESPATASEMRDLVGAYEPAVIGTQESVVWSLRKDPDRLRAHPKLRILIDSLGYNALAPRTGPAGKHWTRWLQPTLGLLPVLSQEQLEFKAGELDPEPLVATRTEFEIDGRPVVHYNIHLLSHGPVKPWDSRQDLFEPTSWLRFLSGVRYRYKRRAAQVMALKARLVTEEQPLIVSGDLNASPDSWEYARISDGMQDAYKRVGQGWGATYPSSRPLVRIDFLLLGPEFEIVRAEVPYTSEVLSDHRPVVVSFRWRNQGHNVG